MFDADFFHEAFDTSPSTNGNAATRVDDVIQRVTKMCDAPMPQRRDVNN